MKKIFGVLLLLLCSAPAAQAQVEWRWSNVTTFGTGFQGTLQFRNTNQFGDPDIVAILGFGVSAKQNIVDRCAPPVLDCFISGLASNTAGSVQRSEFYAGNTRWIEASPYVPVTNSSQYLLSVPWYIGMSGQTDLIGVLGCQVPERPSTFAEYGYRTCTADGFDGWVTAEVVLRVADPSLPDGYYGVDDVNVGFATTILTGPNALHVVPEPSTVALVAFGFGAIALIRRKRRA